MKQAAPSSGNSTGGPKLYLFWRRIRALGKALGLLAVWAFDPRTYYRKYALRDPDKEKANER
jgi:hypothetical protein